MINKGRYNDVIKNDKRTYSAVGLGEIKFVADSLLDRDDEVIDLDQIMDKSKKEGMKRTAVPKGETLGMVREKPIGKAKVKGETPAEEPKEEPKEEVPGNKDADEFMALKSAWPKLKGEPRKRYFELKKKLNM